MLKKNDILEKNISQFERKGSCNNYYEEVHLTVTQRIRQSGGAFDEPSTTNFRRRVPRRFRKSSIYEKERKKKTRKRQREREKYIFFSSSDSLRSQEDHSCWKKKDKKGNK